MIPHHVYYQLAIVGLLWLCIMLHYSGQAEARCHLSHRPHPCPSVQAQTLQRAQTLRGSHATTSLCRV